MRGRNLRRARHRVHEHAFESALPQVARNEPQDEILLGAGRSPSNRARISPLA
jgi:hypothetical protein